VVEQEMERKGWRRGRRWTNMEQTEVIEEVMEEK
jgi:hypothetical protein